LNLKGQGDGGDTYVIQYPITPLAYKDTYPVYYSLSDGYTTWQPLDTWNSGYPSDYASLDWDNATSYNNYYFVPVKNGDYIADNCHKSNSHSITLSENSSSSFIKFTDSYHDVSGSFTNLNLDLRFVASTYDIFVGHDAYQYNDSCKEYKVLRQEFDIIDGHIYEWDSMYDSITDLGFDHKEIYIPIADLKENLDYLTGYFTADDFDIINSVLGLAGSGASIGSILSSLGSLSDVSAAASEALILVAILAIDQIIHNWLANQDSITISDLLQELTSLPNDSVFNISLDITRFHTGLVSYSPSFTNISNFSSVPIMMDINNVSKVGHIYITDASLNSIINTIIDSYGLSAANQLFDFFTI